MRSLFFTGTVTGPAFTSVGTGTVFIVTSRARTIFACVVIGYPAAAVAGLAKSCAVTDLAGLLPAV